MIRFEVSEIPELYVVGKAVRLKMGDIPAGNNPIPALWIECFENASFFTLEQHAEKHFCPDYVGAMVDHSADGFTYVVGMLFTEPVAIDGFTVHALPSSKVGIGYIKGKDTADVCMVAHELTEAGIQAAGLSTKDATWCMELYNCPRYTAPDAEGNIILDYYIPCA